VPGPPEASESESEQSRAKDVLSDSEVDHSEPKGEVERQWAVRPFIVSLFCFYIIIPIDANG
jgi:hypothetical protein